MLLNSSCLDLRVRVAPCMARLIYLMALRGSSQSLWPWAGAVVAGTAWLHNSGARSIAIVRSASASANAKRRPSCAGRM